jgi:hypothetical protein
MFSFPERRHPDTFSLLLTIPPETHIIELDFCSKNVAFLKRQIPKNGFSRPKKCARIGQQFGLSSLALLCVLSTNFLDRVAYPDVRNGVKVKMLEFKAIIPDFDS